MKVAADAGAGAAPADSGSPSAVAAPDAAVGAKPAAPAAKDSGSKNATAPLVKVADKYTAPATPGSSAYKIGPQDVLEISVFKVPELARSVQVADAGTINLPLVGEVQAAGRTASEIERDLAKKLGSKYLQSPQVSVYVKEFNSRRVTIEGAVKKPGVYPIRGKTTLMQFIATAEGTTDPAETDSILVFRTVSGKRSAARFDLDAIRKGEGDDPVIEEGDVIVVNESATKAAFQNLLKAIPITSAFVPLL
jgi:polysaccharide export outer membrane protein